MMKKTLVALAAVGACGAVMAQSSVTLYGVADAGVGRIKTLAGREGKTQFWGGNGLINNTPSRIGLKGTEDIGGGNVVGFVFEHGLSLDTGNNVEFDGAHPFAEAPGGRFWDRSALVYIGGNWGTVKLGRQDILSHLAELAYDFTGLANYSAQRNTYLAAGMGPLDDSVISYYTPNMGGLTAAVSFKSKNDTGNAKNVWDVAAWYNNGPIGASVAVNKGQDGDGKTNYSLGGKYDFGSFAVGGSYHNVASGDGVGPGFDLIRRGFSLTGQAKMGAFSLVLDVTRDTKNQWHPTGKKYTNALLEAKYALSKRTFLYADVLRLDGTNNWGLGINHRF